MGAGRTDEFGKYAVRIALTSGLTRRQVADDLGVGLSTLNKGSVHARGVISGSDVGGLCGGDFAAGFALRRVVTGPVG